MGFKWIKKKKEKADPHRPNMKFVLDTFTNSGSEDENDSKEVEEETHDDDSLNIRGNHPYVRNEDDDEDLDEQEQKHLQAASAHAHHGPDCPYSREFVDSKRLKQKFNNSKSKSEKAKDTFLEWKQKVKVVIHFILLKISTFNIPIYLYPLSYAS